MDAIAYSPTTSALRTVDTLGRPCRNDRALEWPKEDPQVIARQRPHVIGIALLLGALGVLGGCATGQITQTASLQMKDAKIPLDDGTDSTRIVLRDARIVNAPNLPDRLWDRRTCGRPCPRPTGPAVPLATFEGVRSDYRQCRGWCWRRPAGPRWRPESKRGGSHKLVNDIDPPGELRGRGGQLVYMLMASTAQPNPRVRGTLGQSVGLVALQRRR